MTDEKVILTYILHIPEELNFSYMPFIKGGGLFIPTEQIFILGDEVEVDLQLYGKSDAIKILGSVVWITPPHAIHRAIQGIGIQMIGPDAVSHQKMLLNNLLPSIPMGGYVYGISDKDRKEPKT